MYRSRLQPQVGPVCATQQMLTRYAPFYLTQRAEIHIRSQNCYFMTEWLSTGSNQQNFSCKPCVCQEGASALQSAPGNDSNHEAVLVLRPLCNFNGGTDRSTRGDADQESLLLRQPPCHVHRLLAGNLYGSQGDLLQCMVGARVEAQDH